MWPHTCREKMELINWYHSECFNSTRLTWIAEIKQGLFKTWLNVTVKNVKLHLTKLIATNLGSIKQTIKVMETTNMPQQSTEKSWFLRWLMTLNPRYTQIWMSNSQSFQNQGTGTSPSDILKTETPSCQIPWRIFPTVLWSQPTKISSRPYA